MCNFGNGLAVLYQVIVNLIFVGVERTQVILSYTFYNKARPNFLIYIKQYISIDLKCKLPYSLKSKFFC